jgi:hypothetical protein
MDEGHYIIELGNLGGVRVKFHVDHLPHKDSRK